MSDQLKECSDSKGMQSVLNGRNLNIILWGGGFHMIPRSYKFSYSLCLDDFLQVWLIGNKRDQVCPFIYMNQDGEVSHLVRGSKVLGDMKYLIRSVKRAAKAVQIWTEENWDIKRVNSLYTMVSGGFIFKINKRFDSLS